MKLKILMTLAIGPMLLNCQSLKRFYDEFDGLPRWFTPNTEGG